MNHKYLIAIVFALLLSFSCKEKDKEENSGEPIEEVQAEHIVYRASLTALNSGITKMNTHGEAKFVIENEEVQVTIQVSNAPPNMQHWQHFHGFPDGANADCATEAEDSNGDGIVDVVETETVSGTTMVPFNARPEDMDLAQDSYPQASDDGSYSYEVTIPLEELEAAFADAFGGDSLELDKRVLYVHGIPSNINLPETVQSVGDIPAHTTLPIACGKIIKVSE